MPAPSEFGIITSNAGLVTPGRAPARALASDGFAPEYSSSTKTSPAAGVGVSIWTSVITSLAGPKAEYVTARMGLSFFAKSDYNVDRCDFGAVWGIGHLHDFQVFCRRIA